MASDIVNYNIKQITGYDIKDKPSIYYQIIVPKKTDEGVIDVTETVEYKTILTNVEILKLGYCCESKGIIYPIFLEMDNSYKQIKIGKDGMYEMQPENWVDNSDIEPEDRITDIIITGVRVPNNINFTLDYVIAIN